MEGKKVDDLRQYKTEDLILSFRLEFKSGYLVYTGIYMDVWTRSESLKHVGYSISAANLSFQTLRSRKF